MIPFMAGASCWQVSVHGAQRPGASGYRTSRSTALNESIWGSNLNKIAALRGVHCLNGFIVGDERLKRERLFLHNVHHHVAELFAVAPGGGEVFVVSRAG